MYVSIITPTSYQRRQSLLFVAKCVARQKYKHIIEWIIIDGGSHNNQLFTLFVEQSLVGMSGLPKIVFISSENVPERSYIGTIRNIANKKASGDILINFDDDDYYPDLRVSHTVQRMCEHNADLAVCSPNYMYDYNSKTLYQFSNFGRGHGIGCTIACTRSYAAEHVYGEEKCHAEEYSFLAEYTYKNCVQLDPKLTVINSAHDNNTFDKRKIIFPIMMGKRSQNLRKIPEGLSLLIKNKEERTEYRMLHSNRPRDHILYDIVYILGTTKWNMEFRYKKHILQQFEKWRHRTIGVYGNFPEHYVCNGIHYHPIYELYISKEYSNIIVGQAGYSVFETYYKLGLQSTRLFFDMFDGVFFTKNKKLNRSLNTSIFHEILCKKNVFHNTKTCLHFTIINN